MNPKKQKPVAGAGSSFQPRQNGTSTRGRYDFRRRQEADASGSLVTADTSVEAGSGSAVLEQVAAARNHTDLDAFISHPDPYVRAEVASSPYLTSEQAWRMSDDPDWGVRWQIARRHVEGVSDYLSDDPDEVVRAQCLGDPELSRQARDRLESDAEVRALFHRLEPLNH